MNFIKYVWKNDEFLLILPLIYVLVISIVISIFFLETKITFAFIILIFPIYMSVKSLYYLYKDFISAYEKYKKSNINQGGD